MTPGESAFNAYNATGPNPGKTWDGKPVPAWADVGDQVRAKWEAAAAALLPRWVPVTESLPDPYRMVLVWAKRHPSHFGGAPTVVVDQQTDFDGWKGEGDEYAEATHWMPLPGGPR